MSLISFLCIVVVPTLANACCDVNVIVPKAGRVVTTFPPLKDCPTTAWFFCSASGGKERTVLSINFNKTIAVGLPNEHSVAPLACVDKKWYSTYCERFAQTIDCM